MTSPARGCTPESCGFRDHAADLAAAGAAVAGVSTQSTAYQQEAAERLGLPFPLLSDAQLQLAGALKLPTFMVDVPPEQDGGGRCALVVRLTLVVRVKGVIGDRAATNGSKSGSRDQLEQRDSGEEDESAGA